MLTKLFIVLFLLTLCSCMENRVNSPNDRPGSQFRGSVKLLSEDNSFEINKNLVLVRLEGTGYETLTDTAGKWTLNLIPQGTYTIVYSKPGYSTAKRFSVRCDGIYPVIVSPMTLAQIPTHTIDSMSTSIENDSIVITCHSNMSLQKERNVILYFDTTLMDQQTRNTYLFTNLDMKFNPFETTASIKIPLNYFATFGIRTPKTMFCTSFGIVRFEATADESFLSIDPQTKKTLFWNTRQPGAVSSFVLP